MKKKVLIIEDDKKNMMLEKILLEAGGFEVFQAINGANGLAIAVEKIPDCIVLDLRLPDMQGNEIAEIIRRDKRIMHIPIVFVTASVLKGEDVLEETKIISNSGVIMKPINTRTFAEEIGKYIT